MYVLFALQQGRYQGLCTGVVCKDHCEPIVMTRLSREYGFGDKSGLSAGKLSWHEAIARKCNV
jgi:hypothetical protein